MRLNFSNTEVRDFEPVPAGWYLCAITDVDVREVSQGDNAGKEYLNIEFTIQDGEYENRKFWTNAMLFEPALFTIAGILKAVGYDTSGEVDLDYQDLVGKQLNVRVRVRPANDEKGYDASNEVKGFKPADAKVSAGAGSGLLP